MSTIPNFDFVPIELAELPINFISNCEIYSGKTKDLHEEQESEFALLCGNQTITSALISRLKQTVFPHTKVYIKREAVITFFFNRGHFLGYSKEDVESIRRGETPWEIKSEPLKVPQFFEHIAKGSGTTVHSNVGNAVRDSKFQKTVERYDKTKSAAVSLLENTKKTGRVDHEHSLKIVGDVQKQVNETDSSLIIQTINRIRSVDEYLHTHSLNVAYLNSLIGKWFKFSPERQSDLTQAGLFHDLGKLEIDPEILNKPSSLTLEEFEEIKRHPALSLEILMKSGIRNKEVLEGVIQHHEKLNGTGYPQGIGTKGIGEFARITSISDIYDAMVTKRCYKDPLSPFAILDQFTLGGFSELDLKYVNTFINCMAEDLKGKEVVLNDGRTAEVRFVNTKKPLNSIIEIDGNAFTMDEELYCVKMKDA